MQIHASSENYLETILILRQERGAVRSIDIAHHLDFSKPSISRAMGLLRENGYITMDKDGLIELTPLGEEIAVRMYERHQLLTRWLTHLGVPPDTAAEDACRIEHDISRETFACLKRYIAAQDIPE